MQTAYNEIIPALWILWFIYWKLAALKVKPTVRRESVGFRIFYMGLLVLGASMFTTTDRHLTWLNQQLWPRTAPGYWLGIAIVVAGFAFTVWARVTLGRNWSSTVTVKEQHELVQTGPYALVRHPIYTGLLVMFLGSGLALDERRAVLGLAIVLVSFLIKLRLEEKWMTEIFGPAYEAYRKRVALLVPFLW